jgi:hypothetical protein
MSSGQMVHIVPLAIGSLISVEARPVPRGHATLDEPDRISGETIDRRGRGTTALKDSQAAQNNRNGYSAGDSWKRHWPHELKLIQ